ncbi:unnamed protein product [Heterobilharzia americana]|nr:unnamed protein product [Heterobilharzia americana]
MYKLRMKKYFRTFPFLRLFLVINSISFLIYFLLLLINNYRFPNSNYHASVIRDHDETRLAHLRSLIYDWYTSGKLPFSYRSPSLSLSSSSSSSMTDKYGIIIGILLSNHPEYKIDDYQTYYLTESLATLIQLIFQDISKYGYRFKSISIIICSGGSNQTISKNIPSSNEIVRLVGKNSIRPLSTDRDQSLLNLSLSCLVVKATSKCMLEAFKLTKAQENDYILIMRDDMIPRDNLFDVLWKILYQPVNSHTLGMIQLYSRDNVLKFPFHHGTDRKIFELSFSLISLSVIVVLFTFTRFTARPFIAAYNVVLFLCTFITLFMLMFMYG